MADQPSTTLGVLSQSEPSQSGIVRTIAVVAGIVVSALLVNLAATLVVASAIGSDVSEIIPFATVVTASELAFLLVGIGYLRFRTSFHLPVRTPTKQVVPYLVGGLIAGFVVLVLQFAITDAVVPAVELSPGFTEYSNIGRVTGSGLIVGAFLSLAVIGPVEEFLFRGVIQERLLESLSPISAVGIASVVFAFFHFYPVALLSPPPVVLIHMAGYYTAMGAIFGWVYYRTDTLVAPALVHGLFNAVLFVSPLLS